jgi:hypothetical protein
MELRCALRRPTGVALSLLCLALPTTVAQAYTAAGDRIFPATLLLPQIAPSDETYMTSRTRQTPDGRATGLSGTFDKSITERLGIAVEEGYNWLTRRNASTLSGWQNTEVTLRYLAVVDQPREFLLSVGVTQEFGGTGTRRIGADPNGATAPTVYFAKGLGDFDVGYLRPLAILGTVGYQVANGGARADQVQTGLAIEYSIPYLTSKVSAIDLPDVIRAMTPMVEFRSSTPATNTRDNAAVHEIAPGFSFAGEGWEFAIAALLPLNRAAGTGPGVTAQFHLSLDFFFPQSIGKPLFPR